MIFSTFVILFYFGSGSGSEMHSCSGSSSAKAKSSGFRLVLFPQDCLYCTSVFSWQLLFLCSGTVAQRTVSSEWTSTWVGASTSINSKSCSPPSSPWAASFKVTSSAASSNRKRAHSIYSSFNIFNLFAKNGTGSHIIV
jgi:hypothetical protein